MKDYFTLNTVTEEQNSEVIGNCGLEEIYKQSIEIQDLCEDFKVDWKKTFIQSGYESEKGLTFLNDHNSKGGLKPVFMTKHSLSQLCQKIGMNQTYYSTCCDKKAYDLLDDNMNYWIEVYDKPLNVRLFRDNIIRGILSEKFTDFDAPNILEVLLENDFKDEYNLVGSFISPERLHLRFAKHKGLIKKDDIFGGFTVDSSDVGRNVLAVNFFIYKKVCSNGLCLPQIGGNIYNQRHIGVSLKSFKNDFEKSLDRIDILCEKAAEVIECAKGRDITDFLNLKEDDFEGFINKVSNLSSLTVKEVNDKVIPLINTYYESTSWGLVNAVTDAAKSLTLERRLEVEKRAGTLMSLAA